MRMIRNSLFPCMRILYVFERKVSVFVHFFLLVL